MKLRLIIERQVLESLRFLSTLSNGIEHGMYLFGILESDTPYTIIFDDFIYPLNVAPDPRFTFEASSYDISFCFDLLRRCNIDTFTFAHTHPSFSFFSSTDIEWIYERKNIFEEAYREEKDPYLKTKFYLCKIVPEILITADPSKFIFFLAPVEFEVVFVLTRYEHKVVRSISIEELKTLDESIRDDIEAIERKLSCRVLEFFRSCKMIGLSLKWIW